MAYLNRESDSFFEDNAEYKNDKGNHECAYFVQQVSGAPKTSFWKKGFKVIGPGEIAKGTAIATFEGESYKGHAAIFISKDDEGIWVWDQWNRQGKVKKRRIRKKSKYKDDHDKLVNNPDNYYIIN